MPQDSEESVQWPNGHNPDFPILDEVAHTISWLHRQGFPHSLGQGGLTFRGDAGFDHWKRSLHYI